MNFEDWKKEVNSIILEKTGIDMDDLPDWMSRDSFDSGSTPEEAAAECLINANMEELLFDEY